LRRCVDDAGHQFHWLLGWIAHLFLRVCNDERNFPDVVHLYALARFVGANCHETTFVAHYVDAAGVTMNSCGGCSKRLVQLVELIAIGLGAEVYGVVHPLKGTRRRRPAFVPPADLIDEPFATENLVKCAAHDSGRSIIAVYEDTAIAGKQVAH
jgi:hypothetical protein